jgi:WD40-like Beta Propeller Repeat
MSANSSSSIVRFGTFEVNPQTGELRHRGQRVKLQEQPLQVLAALLERPGEIITREELRGKLWPADTFVDFDHSLNAGLGALTAGVLALPFVFYNRTVSSKAGKSTVTPIVTNVGAKYTPSLSPDGQHLAFAWNGGAGDHYSISIYVKLIGSEESIRLAQQASIDFNPVWSPDGRYIAFWRILKGETGIYIIPALGGAERRVRKALWEEQEFYEALGAAAASRGRPMGSYWRSLTVHPVTNLRLLFFSYRSIHRKFADSLRR